MKKAKFLIVLSIIFIIVGALTFAIAFASVGWDIKRLSTTTTRYSSFSASDSTLDLSDVDKIDIEGEAMDVEICYGPELSVTYPEVFTRSGKIAVKVKTTVKNGVLYVSTSTYWLRTFGLFNFSVGKAQIVLPRDKNVDLSVELNTGEVKFIGDASSKTNYVSIETDTGDVVVQDAVAQKLDLETNTGDVKITGSTSVTAGVETDTGSVSVAASVIDTLKVDVDTGGVKINGSEIGKAGIETDTGDVRITDSKIDEMTARTDTGDVKIVGEVAVAKASIKTSTGDVDGKSGILDTSNIKITTSTGDIRLTLKGKISDFSYVINVSTGDSNVSSMMLGDKLFEAKVSTGNVKLYFAE